MYRSQHRKWLPKVWFFVEQLSEYTSCTFLVGFELLKKELFDCICKKQNFPGQHNKKCNECQTSGFVVFKTY